MFYYLGYLIFPIIGGLKVQLDRGSRYPFLFVFYVATIMLFGFREGIGADYDSYIRIFYEIGDGVGYHEYRLEFGYYWLNSILNDAGFSAEVVILLSFFVTFTIIFYTLVKYSNNYFVSILVIVCFGLLFQSTNLIRQCLAFSVCLLSIPYVLRRDFIKFLCVVLFAAFMFHKSSLAFIGVYFVYLMPKSQIFWLFLFALSLATLVFSDKLAQGLASIFGGVDFVYSGYFEDLHHMQRSVAGMRLNLLAEVCIFLALVANINRISNDSISHFFVSVYMLGILLNFAFSESAMLNRLAFYYYEFAFLALPFVAQSIKAGRSRTIFYLLIVLYGFALYFKATFVETSSYFDYSNVLVDGRWSDVSQNR